MAELASFHPANRARLSAIIGGSLERLVVALPWPLDCAGGGIDWGEDCDWARDGAWDGGGLRAGAGTGGGPWRWSGAGVLGSGGGPVRDLDAD